MADSFQDRIGVFYSGLSKGHKRIADFIKNNYEKASFMTAAKLGKTVGVSESTVVRFASHVGFDGYPELQKHLQELVKSHLTPLRLRALPHSISIIFVTTSCSSTPPQPVRCLSRCLG